MNTLAPAADRTVATTDNFGDGATAFANELAQFEEDCARLAKLAVDAEGELDAEAIAANQTKFSDLVNRERALRQAATKLKESEKQPFWDECQRIDAAFRFTIAKLADALKAPKARFDAWVLAEDAKREAAAKAAREEAERRRREAEALAAQAQAADPFDAFDAAEQAEAAQADADTATIAAQAVEATRTRVSSSFGRAVSVRTTQTLAVDDYALCFAAVAENKSVREAIEKAAKALHKATGAAPPGCRIVESKAVR